MGVTSDLPPRRPTSEIERPALERPASPTPPSVPAVRDVIRGTPVPINLERFVQKILAAAQPLGNPEKYLRDVIIEGVTARLQKMLASPTSVTRTQFLVTSNLTKIFSEEE